MFFSSTLCVYSLFFHYFYYLLLLKIVFFYFPLQELCLYLDEERNAVGAGLRRDDGDGSSSSTNPDEAATVPPHASGSYIIYRQCNSPKQKNGCVTQGILEETVLT